jgi:hypothetical protein
MIRQLGPGVRLQDHLITGIEKVQILNFSGFWIQTVPDFSAWIGIQAMVITMYIRPAFKQLNSKWHPTPDKIVQISNGF